MTDTTDTPPVTHERTGVYDELHVVELATDLGGEQLGRLLCEHGAHVVKVEPPTGAPSRHVGPWAHGVQSPDTSLTHWFYNAGKRSIVLDLEGPDRAALDDLLAGADVFISTLQPRDLAELGIDLDAIVEANPRLVVASVTPFGLTGPWADRRSSDLVALAGGGPLMSCGYDDHTIPPILPGGNQSYHSAAAQAHMALLLALIQRQSTGRGQVIDTSMHEALAVGGELANPYWFYARALVERQTCRHAQPGRTQPALFECGDGNWVYFVLILGERHAWAALVDWLDAMGLAADLTDPAYDDVAYRQEQFPHIQGLVETLFLLQTAHDAYLEGQSRGLPIGPLNAPEDTVADEHLQAREYFAEVPVLDGETVQMPRTPIRLLSMPLPTPGRPARLGQHTDEVLAHRMGASA